ncbi:uncharacterized protein JCM15063_000639 [Sporobolomyces koalae]|uniref:uncharacterized protein n=1 Tax=Sporobolomyces koalae TaxID=500713 RepID=UPI00316C6C59
MRLYLTTTKPHSVVLDDTGFQIVFLVERSNETGESAIGITVYPPGEQCPFGERDTISDLAGCLGILKWQGRNLLILVQLPLEVVGLQGGVTRIKHVLFFDLEKCRTVNHSTAAFRHLLESGHYYMSHLVNLTKHVALQVADEVQRRQACQPRARKDPTLIPTPCPHHFGLPQFVWNSHLLEPWFELRESLDPKIKAAFDSRGFALPIIEGFFDQQRIELEDGERMFVTVVSRHSRYRDGTRFEKRGIDSQGNVAQFVESETIFETNTRTVSFVQLRGSVPLYWTETPRTTSLNVKILEPVSQSLDPFLKHFRELVANYDNVHALSLLHNHDTVRTHPEQPLSDAYKLLSNAAETDPTLKGRVVYQQYSILRTKMFEVPRRILEATSSVLDQIGVTLCSADAQTGALSIVEHQKGVFRVNCRDCCDRTTLGQWSLAREAISRTLDQLEYDERAKVKVDKAIGELWAKNGNALSLIYTGADALFTRFIRTGQYSQVQQTLDNTHAMEERLVHHYAFDKEKTRAIEILTGESEEQESPPKLVLVSHRVDVVNTELSHKQGEKDKAWFTTTSSLVQI